MEWLLLALGLVLLVSGADCLVKGAARLALSFGIPSLVIGLTVVAFGTSAPELAVSLKAAASGEAELAIANVVGSNIFNVLFILGLSALIAPLVVSHQLIRQDVPVMIVTSLLVLAMAFDGSLVRWEAAVLTVGLVAYTAFLFVQGKKQGAQDGEVDELLQTPAPLWKNLLLIAVGLALLVWGSRWLVQSAVSIAQAWGVNEAVIGLTIIAAGTSLPEVTTSVMATIKGEREIAIGNVVGSNIFNILGVLGLSGLISAEALTAGAQMARIDIPVMVAVAALCLPLFFTGVLLNRIEGGLFLLLYAAYLAYMIALALASPLIATLQAGILFGLIPLVAFYVVYSLWRDVVDRRT